MIFYMGAKEYNLASFEEVCYLEDGYSIVLDRLIDMFMLWQDKDGDGLVQEYERVVESLRKAQFVGSLPLDKGELIDCFHRAIAEEYEEEWDGFLSFVLPGKHNPFSLTPNGPEYLHRNVVRKVEGRGQ